MNGGKPIDIALTIGRDLPASPSATNFHELQSQRSNSSLQESMITTHYESVEEKELSSITTQRKVFLVASAVITLAAVITLIIVFVHADGNSDTLNESPRSIPATLLALSNVAVTNISLVSAPSGDDAKDSCVERAWIPTGVEWAALSDNSISFLCMQQSVEATESSDDVGTTDLNAVSVMRRLVVVSNAKACPTNMQMLVNLNSNLFVCMEFVSASTAFDTQQYVVDVMTTTESFYNNEKPGWITWPANLKMDSATSGIYLSVRYPIRPIVALQVLTYVTTATIYSACEELEPRGEWESPQFVLKSSEGATVNSDSSDILICVQRLLANATGLTSVLTDINVVAPTESCSGAETSANITEILSDRVKLCARWGLVDFANSSSSLSSRAATSSFVAELSLYETSEAESEQLDISSTIPGDWTVVGTAFTGTVQTFVMARKHKPIALNSTSDSFHASKNDVSSTVEAIASSSSETLAFKVLQITDMHITGNPDLQCSSGPRTFRASLLAAASDIAESLRIESNSSSSVRAGEDNDPMYNECREALTIAFLDELLEIEQPDFVVFTGDNVHTDSDSRIHAFAINVFTERVERRKIPWAAVFGNHDAEGGLTREEMLALMVDGKQFSHVKHGPRDIDGVGNYEVNVVAPRDGPWGEQGSTVFRMYFLDSLATIDTTVYPLLNDVSDYDWIKMSQIDFYRQLAKSHIAEMTTGDRNSSHNGSVPAVMFYHIPIPEYALVSPLNRAGDKNEVVHSAAVNTGLFSALVEVGDVKATFVGHDHINDYCYSRQGIQLCYGGGIGLGRAYGLTNFNRRARVLEWTYNANQSCTLQSWMRHLDDPSQIRSLEILYSE